MYRPSTRIAAFAATLVLAGCAAHPERRTDPVNDPWEGYNRQMHGFNTAVDRAVLRPVARGYVKVAPDGVQYMLSNFYTNIAQPVTILNTALQGKFKESLQSTGRFALNLVLGLGGLFDPATDAGLPLHVEDFGQTLAVWGWEDSRYFVLPVFGPSTVRDGLGQGLLNGGAAAGTGGLDPVAWYAAEENNYLPLAGSIVVRRAALLPLTDEFEGAYDPYALMRDAWLQRREYEIYDGNPPLPDYDALLDDIE